MFISDICMFKTIFVILSCIMLKPTRNNLKKLESLFEELEYVVRYEKGNFQSGYCIVQDRQIAIVNKFYDTEGRINCLIDILSSLEIDSEKLSEPSQKVYKQVIKEIAKTAKAEKNTVPSDSK